MKRDSGERNQHAGVIRRFLRFGGVLCLLVLLLTSGCVNLPTASGPVFHREPGTVREHFQAWLLFAQLGSALQAVASEQFGSSGEQLATVTVDRAHLPSGLVDLASRYIDLCNELADTIHQLYDTLQQVENLLAANDVQRAGLALEAGRTLIDQAREQLSALERATLEVFAMLQRSGSGGSTAQLAQARQSLDVAIERLLQLATEYENRLELAGAVANDERLLVQPQMTLQVDRDAAWVGETVLLSGTVTALGAPLADRELVLRMDGVEVARVRSEERGSFVCALVIPFEYVPLRVVQMVFLPVGGDLGRYRGASSDEVALTVRFHQSQVALDPLDSLYPGLAASLGGTVVSSGSVAGRTVEVRLGDEVIGEALTGPEGGFVCAVTLPDDAEEGESAIEVRVSADAAALTAPGLADATVDIVRVAPRIDVTVGRLLVVPTASMSLPRQLLGGDFVRMVPVSGDVRSSLPMETPAVTAWWGERQVRWQQQEASFEREVPLVISVWSMGVRTVTVRATPREPWLKPGEATAHLLVVNFFMPFVWLTALLAAFGLGLVSRRRWVAGHPTWRTGLAAPEPASTILPTATRGLWMDDNDRDSRSALVVFYYRAVGFLQAGLGVNMRSEMTLREYLAALAHRLAAGTRLFARLTSLAEEALYGPREPGHREVTLGRRLLMALRRTRHGDMPGGEGDA